MFDQQLQAMKVHATKGATEMVVTRAHYLTSLLPLWLRRTHRQRIWYYFTINLPSTNDKVTATVVVFSQRWLTDCAAEL